MLCEHGNISPCVECDIEPLEADNRLLRQKLDRTQATLNGIISALNALDVASPYFNIEVLQDSKVYSCNHCSFAVAGVDDPVVKHDDDCPVVALLTLLTNGDSND